jgi:hypothetical protein
MAAARARHIGMLVLVLLISRESNAQMQNLVDLDRITNGVRESSSGGTDYGFHAGPLDFGQFFVGCV